MKKKILTILISILALCMCMFTLTACGGGNSGDNSGGANTGNGDNPPVHTCVYDKQLTTDDYIFSKATCVSKARYYYSCSCGEKGEETFEHGSALGHAYGDWVSTQNGQHKKTCANDNSHTIIENCSGGTATCTEKAKCKDCGAEHGSVLQHNFGTPTYAWEGNQCTATRVCSRNSTHVETETVTATYFKDTDATCTTLEKGHYIATFTNSNFTTQTTAKNSASVGTTKPHEHTKLEKDVTGHWKECICGDKSGFESHNPSASATETTDQVCTECGYVITPALGHVHTLHLTKVDAKAQSCTEEGNREYYICSCSKWFTDNTATTEIIDKTSVAIAKDAHKYENLKKSATQHWYECTCGDKDGLEEHHGGSATCTEKAVCDDCGIEYGLKKPHSYTILKQSATQHWYECSCGAFETKDNHEGGTATCQVKASCSICDTVYGNFAEHEPKTAWVITDTHHYHECVYGCTEKLNYQEHSFTNYVSNKDATYESDGTKTATCNGGCGKTHTVTDAGSMLIKDEIRFSTLTVDGKNVYGKVSNATTEFVFYEEIFVSGNATYVVDNDKDCSSPIDSKTVDLVVGDNTFYVLETVGNNVKLYTVTIHRREMFTVTFNTNGGTAVDSQIVEEDSLATAPTTSKTGYTFAGWDYDFNTAITGNTTINASWTAIEYEIVYNLNNGSLNTDKNKYTIEQTITFDNPTRDYYTFSGWYNNADFNGSKITKLTIGTYGDIELYAKWTPIDYGITYVLNGGTNDKNNPTKYNVETSTITLNNPTRDGYTFDGWYLEETFNTEVTQIEQGSHDNVKLYAKWNIVEYDIIYNLNGGNISTNKNKYTIEQAVALDNPTRDYYTFSGWYDNADFSGDAVTGIVVGSYGDIELYAKWTPIDYTITYNYGYGDEIEVVPTNAYTTINDSTYKWTLSNGVWASGNKGVNSSKSVYKITANSNVTVTFDYKVSSESSYDKLIIALNGTEKVNISGSTSYVSYSITLKTGDSLTFTYSKDSSEHKNDDKAYIKNLTYVVEPCIDIEEIVTTEIYNIETQTFDLITPTRDGYTFNGWYLEEDFVAKVTEIEQGSHGNITLYAKWTENVNGLNFNGNGATSGEMQAIELKTGEEKVLPTNAFVRMGYTFKGWSKVANGEVVYNDGANYTMGTENQYTLYAVWEANLNTLTFNGNGATGGSTSSMQIRTDASATLNSNGFTKTGYTFKGWSTSVNGEVEFTDGANYTMGTENQYILYAVWEINLNIIIFDGNGATSGETTSQQIYYDNTEKLNANGYIREGYTFKGWSTSSSGSVIYADGSSYTMGANNSYTLYAVWEANLNTIYFNGNGATSGEMYSIQAYTGETITLPSNGYYLSDDYTFGGWSISETADCEYSNEANYIVGAEEKQTLYAYWEQQTKDGLSWSLNDDEITITDCLTSVTNIIVPSTIANYPVTSIGSGAFYGCNKLTSVTIGNGVTWIGSRAFYDCKSLKKVNYLGTIDQWSQISFNYSYYYNDYTSNPIYYARNLYTDNELVKNVELTTTKTVSQYAFYNCSTIQCVVVGNSVTAIEDRAFYNCSSLTSVVIPDSVISIGSAAFSGCSKLTSIEIPNSVTSIGYGAFYNCNALTYLSIPFVGASPSANNGYDQVFGYIFGYTSNSNYKQPEGTSDQYGEWIGSYYYRYYYYIPSSIKEVKIIGEYDIPNYAFNDCEMINHVDICEGVKVIGKAAFSGYGLDSIVIPKSIIEIKDYAFQAGDIYYKSRTIYYLGNSSEWATINIGYDAFYRNSNIIYYYQNDMPEYNSLNKEWCYINGVPTIWGSSPESAVSVDIGVDINTAIFKDGQVVYYKFVASQNENYYIKATSEEASAGFRFITASLYSFEQSLMATNASLGKYSYMIQTLKMNETYYLAVSYTSGGTGQFTLSIYNK